MAFNIQEIRSDIASAINKNPEAFQAALSSQGIFLSKYAKRLTKIDGEYPSVVALIGHVVQAYYSKKFTPFSDVTWKKKDLKTFRQKVDFTLDPAEILGTIYAGKFDEGKKTQDKTISKEIMAMVLGKVFSDLDYLSVNGVYDATKVGVDNPVFGFSMDGIEEILTNILADTSNPAYLIPGDAITANNIVDQVTKFEKNLPSLAKPRVKYLFTSDQDLEEYQEAYDDRFGERPSFNSSDAVKTRFGKRELVGVPGLAKGTLYASIENNFVELVDVVDNPAQFTDVQVDKRVLNLLGEFSLGYDWAVNQYLYVHTSDGTKNLGLNDSVQNKLFYPNESKIN